MMKSLSSRKWPWATIAIFTVATFLIGGQVTYQVMGGDRAVAATTPPGVVECPGSDIANCTFTMVVSGDSCLGQSDSLLYGVREKDVLLVTLSCPNPRTGRGVEVARREIRLNDLVLGIPRKGYVAPVDLEDIMFVRAVDAGWDPARTVGPFPVVIR